MKWSRNVRYRNRRRIGVDIAVDVGVRIGTLICQAHGGRFGNRSGSLELYIRVLLLGCLEWIDGRVRVGVGVGVGVLGLVLGLVLGCTIILRLRLRLLHLLHLHFHLHLHLHLLRIERLALLVAELLLHHTTNVNIVRKQ